MKKHEPIDQSKPISDAGVWTSILKSWKKGENNMTTLSIEEKLAKATDAHLRLETAKTADEIRNVFADTYATLGHKVLGRMVLHQTPEKALRIDSKKE